jgi:hypothetical protein
MFDIERRSFRRREILLEISFRVRRFFLPFFLRDLFGSEQVYGRWRERYRVPVVVERWCTRFG